LRDEFGVKELGVFGSYVTGRQRSDSDLDILVDFDEGHRLTMFEFVRLERHLSKLLGVKVDLVMKSALKPSIGERILAQVLPV
jgi:predicted nucleotidyltransferase